MRKNNSCQSLRPHRFFRFSPLAGFTLLEFLIYLGLISLVLTMAGAVALNIMFRKAKLTAIKEVSQNARLVSGRVSAIARNAQSIISPAAGNNTSVLSLQMADTAKDPTVIDLSNGAVRIKEGLGNAVNLTSGQVEITNLDFSNISYFQTPGTVRMQIVIKFVNPSGRSEYDWSMPFFTTVNIRKK